MTADATVRELQLQTSTSLPQLVAPQHSRVSDIDGYAAAGRASDIVDYMVGYAVATHVVSDMVGYSVASRVYGSWLCCRPLHCF